MYVLQGAELGAGRAAPERARWSPRVTLLPQPALWGPRPHPPGWIRAPPRQQPPPPGRGPPGTRLALLRASLALLPGLLPGPGNLSFPSPRQSLLHTQSRPLPAQPVLCLSDPRPRSVLTGQRPHLPGPGRFRSRRRGPAWRAPGRVRPGPPWAFAPSLMPRTASGSLGTAACREALARCCFQGPVSPEPGAAPCLARRVARPTSGSSPQGVRDPEAPQSFPLGPAHGSLTAPSARAPLPLRTRHPAGLPR